MTNDDKDYWLVVWNIFLCFHSVGNVIIPTDVLIVFSEGWLNHQPVRDNYPKMTSKIRLVKFNSG